MKEAKAAVHKKKKKHHNHNEELCVPYIIFLQKLRALLLLPVTALQMFGPEPNTALAAPTNEAQ
jgi:hypothetical protein